MDIHHIEAWARCREHQFENLIALCPNCHRRAEAGEIDRQSLRIYKARLAAAFRYELANAYPEETVPPASLGWVDPARNWTSRQLIHETTSVEIGLEYPQFRGPILGAATADVNRYVRKRIQAEFDKLLATHKHPLDPESTIPHQLHSSFSVSLVSSELVSVRLSMSAFTGGAHGSHWTEPINIWVVPVREIGLADIFSDVSLGLDALAMFCRTYLLKVDQPFYSQAEQHVIRGTEPSPENYRAFNLTHSGILVTFDEYQVGCYAEGPSEIHVPYTMVRPFLSEPLHAIVRRDA